MASKKRRLGFIAIMVNDYDKVIEYYTEIVFLREEEPQGSFPKIALHCLSAGKPTLCGL